MTSTSPLPPLVRTIDVSWSPDAAFRRFTADFGTWWPSHTHSIGGDKVKRVIFECAPQGRIIEELVDGRRFQWGKIVQFDPPHRVVFTWHPSRDEAESQNVEVRFHPNGAGTRVELISTGWEKFGRRAKIARRGHVVGWGAVLSSFAERRSGATMVFAVLSGAITLVLRATGRLDSMIDRAGGRISAAER